MRSTFNGGGMSVIFLSFQVLHVCPLRVEKGIKFLNMNYGRMAYSWVCGIGFAIDDCAPVALDSSLAVKQPITIWSMRVGAADGMTRVGVLCALCSLISALWMACSLISSLVILETFSPNRSHPPPPPKSGR